MIVIWRVERAYLVVQLVRAFHMYLTMQFGPQGCPRATRKRNRPCLFLSPLMRSIQLVYVLFNMRSSADTTLLQTGSCCIV